MKPTFTLKCCCHFTQRLAEISLTVNSIFHNYLVSKVANIANDNSFTGFCFDLVPNEVF